MTIPPPLSPPHLIHAPTGWYTQRTRTARTGSVGACCAGASESMAGACGLVIARCCKVRAAVLAVLFNLISGNPGSRPAYFHTLIGQLNF